MSTMSTKETMFDRWALPLANSLPLRELENSMGEGRALKIGIDAEHFLHRFGGKEPLNGALGGDPLVLEERIVNELGHLKKLNCEVLFFFHGCEYGPATDPFAAGNKAVEINNAAFSKYEEANPNEAIQIFKNNDFPEIAPILAWLKAVLAKNDIPFMTAPFSAYAQMVDAFSQGIIDMYYASTEIFLFGAGQIITSIDLKIENVKSTTANGEETTTSSVNVDSSTFRILDLEILASAHLRVPEVIVKDAMILAGSSKLPVFQPWADLHFGSTFSFAEAVNVLNRWDGNILGFIESSTMDAKSTYWDQYMQVATAVQYMPVLHHINEVVPANAKNVPNDLQTALGLHLPDELNYYLYMGLISPKTLNWLSSGKITISAPFEVGDDTYKKLVKDTLHPWRQQSYSLLASNLYRYFLKRPVTTEYWFEPSSEASAEEPPAVDREPLALWRVKESDVVTKASKLETKPRSLLFALESLSDGSFAERTISTKPKEGETTPLKTGNELICNVVWRSLYLRGYVDKQHRLTGWGKVALAAVSKSGHVKEQNEAAFVLVELLRAKIISPKAVFAAGKKDGNDERYTDFITKVMSAGQMVHQIKGYSGPLSRSLLAFHASVSAIRSSLRDLLEVTLVNLFLWGEGDRARGDFTDLAGTLPFQERFSCGLGILMSTYLDQYQKRVGEAESPAELNEALKARMQMYVAHLHVGPSLDRANQLWDALMAAVKAADDLIDKEDKQHFEDMDSWFARRRPGTGNPVIPNGT